MQNIGDYQGDDPPYSDNNLLNLDNQNDNLPPMGNKNDNSLQMNESNNSDRNGDFNDLSNNHFQTKNNQFLTEVNLLDQISDNARKDSQFSEIQKLLIDKNDLQQYEKALKNIYSQFDNICSQKMLKLINRIMQVQSSNILHMQFFIRGLLFIFKVLSKLKNITNIMKYKNLLAQILNSTNNIYSIRLTQDEMELLKYYVYQFQNNKQTDDAMINEDIDQYFGEEIILIKEDRLNFRTDYVETITSIINDHFSNQEPQLIVQHFQKDLYKFVYQIACESCYRNSNSHAEMSIFLISKAPNSSLSSHYFHKFEKSIYITDFGVLQRRIIEDYITQITPIASNDLETTKKYIFRPIYSLLYQSDQIQRKISGFKMLGTLIDHTKSNHFFKLYLIQWLKHQQILENFLRQSTNHRILQNIGSILLFLYQNNCVSSQFLQNLIIMSLHSEDIVKLVQTMMIWLQFQDIEITVNIFSSSRYRQAPNLSQLLSNLILNKTLESILTKKRKNIILQDNSLNHDRQLIPNKLMLPQFDQQQQQSQDSYPISNMIIRIMRLLIQLTNYNLQMYIPILGKLINNYINPLKQQFQQQSFSLIKKFQPAGIWILDQCLKCEVGKNQYVNKLFGDGGYQFILAILAKNRYTKLIAQKVLQIIIVLSKTHKPLQRNITQFLWKVLGLTARDEKQRQQFFVFLKQIVRYEGSIHQQSVNYIYFQILMSLNVQWFSARIYDCLQMLFFRLNQDCKLISFQKDHYKVHDSQLIGVDKLWYIYFNSPSQTIIKKCKDVIFKLIKYSGQKQQQLYQQAVKNIQSYITAALNLQNQMSNKQQILLNRIFQIAQKLQFQRDSSDQFVKPAILTLKIIDLCPYSYKKMNSFDLNDNLTLSQMKKYIGQNLNPPRRPTQMQLLNKGKILVGENQTLKQLKISNNETITINLIVQQKQNIKQQDYKQEYLSSLKLLFQDQYQVDFLEFIIKKYQGYAYEGIVDSMFQQSKIQNLKQQFQRKKQQSQEMTKNPKRFAQMLVESKDDILLLMKGYLKNQNKRKTWQFIKKLPINQYYLEIVLKQIENNDWNTLFANKTVEEDIYIVYLVYLVLKKQDKDIRNIFQEKGLKKFIIQWIIDIIDHKKQIVATYDILFQLLLLSTKTKLFAKFDLFLKDGQKNYQTEDQIWQKDQQQTMMLDEEQPIISQVDCSRLLEFIAIYKPSQRIVIHIFKIYLHQLYYSQDKHKCYSILSNQNLLNLVLKYGDCVFYAVSSTAQLAQTYPQLLKHQNLSVLSFDLIKQYQQISEKRNIANIPSLFNCIKDLISKSPIAQYKLEDQFFINTLIYFKTNIKLFNEKDILGYLKILLILVNRHLKIYGNNTETSEMIEVICWLFDQYLFGIDNPSALYKIKQIRKASYTLIKTFCAYQQINNKIIESIRTVMGNFKSTQIEEGQFRTSEFIGMKNLGATCYINSLLQQLYHTKFALYLLEDDQKKDLNDVKLSQLKKIFVNLYIGEKSLVDPTKYVETVKINGQNIRPIVQQDVNEYFASLMHEIESTIGNRAISQTISGTICHQIKGLEEGAEIKINQQPFLTIMLQIKYKRNFFDALQAPNQIHYLEGDNMYYSDVLKKKIRATSRMYLNKLPNLLIFTLKRFSWNHQTMSRSKLNDYFQFPTKLNLYDYTNQTERDEHYFDYELCGILIHSGSAQSGHYYSYIKVKQKWMEFNDRKVNQWDINNLKHECFGGISDDKNRNAYMLFYQRVNSQSHGIFLHQLPSSNVVMQFVRHQNEKFIKNRLIYDSNYINFIQSMACLHNNTILKEIIGNLISTNKDEVMKNEIDNNSLI